MMAAACGHPAQAGAAHSTHASRQSRVSSLSSVVSGNQIAKLTGSIFSIIMGFSWDKKTYFGLNY